MNKVIELLLTYVLKPLIEKGFKYFYRMAKDWYERRKLKKENKEKVENYKEADDIDSSADEFSKLPWY